MSLRINPDNTGDLLAALNRIREQENNALLQIASGRRINSLSEDPTASAALVQNRTRIMETDQFLRNLSSLGGLFQLADSTLSSVVLALTRAISLGVQGANGTLSQENRLAVAGEVRGLQEQLVGLANLTFQGIYVFAGTAVTTQPFALDPASPSGVRYDGNTGVNTVEIADGQIIQTNLPGDTIFSDPTADVFLAIRNLIDTLETGTSGDVGNATTQLRQAFDHVNTQRAFYGNALNRLETTELFLNRENVELNRRENDLVGADLAASITILSQTQNTRNALLAATSSISRLSLFDFLR